MRCGRGGGQRCPGEVRGGERMCVQTTAMPFNEMWLTIPPALKRNLFSPRLHDLSHTIFTDHVIRQREQSR